MATIWNSENRRLTLEEMQENATTLYNIFTEWGWSLNAIAGMLGNMQSESTISPGVVEGYATNNPPTKGYGLIQWTNTKATNVHQNTLWEWTYNNYGDYEWYLGDRQCIFIDSDDRYNWIMTSSYPISYNTFKTSNATPEYLARAYFYNRERGTWSSARESQARYWYDFLSGVTPVPPEPPIPPDPPHPIVKDKKKMPLYMYPSYKQSH